MRFWQRTLLTTMAVGTGLVPMASRAAEPGSAGALFLRLGHGARAAGMGEASVAVAEDASSVYYNPAAMAVVQGTNLVLMHSEYLLSMRLEQAALTHETEWGTFGFMFTGLYMDDMERREDVATATPLGTFSAYDVAVSVGFARYLTPNLSLGVAVKPIYERLDESSASGIGVDAGIYHVSQIEGVKLAAAVANLGAPMKFEEEEFALPRYVKVGASYESEVASIDGGVLITFDAMFPNDDNVRQHIGAEYHYQRMFFLRGGFKAGYDVQGATFGVGVKYREIGFDYAWGESANDFDDSHRFGLVFNL